MVIYMNLSISKIFNKIKYIWNHSGFQKYFKNTGWMFLSKFGTMIFSFVATIYVVRYLQPVQYGSLNYAISFVGIFSFLSSLGIENILYRDLVKSPEKQNEYFGTAFTLRMCGALLAFLSVLTSFLFLDNTLRNRLVIIVVASGFFFQPFAVMAYYFQAKAISKSIAISGFFAVISLSLLKVIFVFLKADIIIFSLIFLLEPVFFAIAYGLSYYRYGNRISNWRFDKNVAKSMLTASWPLMFSSAFVVVYSRIDQVMLKSFFNEYTVGIYSVAAQLSEYWYFIPIGIITSLVPAIVNGKITSSEVYKKRAKWLAIYIVGLTVSAATLMTFFAKPIIILIYGEGYITAAPVLRIYIWGGVGMSLGMVANQLLIVENKTKIFFLSNMISMICNVVLNLILIPRFGMNGAAFSTLVSYSLVPLPYLFAGDNSKKKI